MTGAAEEARVLPRPGGTGIAYRITRSRTPGVPALVLLHGLASNMTRWSEFVEHTRLAEQHDLIRMDLRGHGASGTRGAIGLEVWADDLMALLDREGHARAVLVGHSLGAQLALHCAARHPQRVAGAVLIDPVFAAALRGRRALLAASAPLLRAVVGAVRALNALGLRRRALEPLDLRQLDRLARQALATPEGEAAFIRQYSSTRADLRSTRTAHYLQDLVEMFRAAPDPATVTQPLLVLLSSGGTFADPGLMHEFIARYAHSHTETIDCHHWPLTERPAEVRAVIEAWCAVQHWPRHTG
jgi:pimeloyl-ACP methyl ester carboxylesterase